MTFAKLTLEPSKSPLCALPAAWKRPGLHVLFIHRACLDFIGEAVLLSGGDGAGGCAVESFLKCEDSLLCCCSNLYVMESGS